MNRLRGLDRTFDLLIVGGGIIGAGIARDAALRGLDVALVEKADYGGGTTAGSTRLIHGGLRYLAMLDFRLVRLDLRERETLLRIAPHLVKPLAFLIPFHGRNPLYRAKLQAGLRLYDALSRDRSLPGHRFLTAAEVRREEPCLEVRGLQGAALYYDAQVDSPERLALENILDARARGAVALNYCEAVGRAPGGLLVRDTITEATTEVRARVMVNAAGPWFDRVAARIAPPHPRPLIRTTKGIHLACAPVSRQANVLFSRVDGRLFFVIPWQGYSWVGTTDTDFTGDPALARATREDADYLLASARPFFPGLAAPYWSNAGVRALVTAKGDESSVSRLHRVHSAPGLVSVLGGKITGYRAIAEEATEAVCSQLKTPRRERSLTAETPLPPPAPQPDLASAATYAARREQCLRVSDFLLRRTTLGFAPDQGLGVLDSVADALARAWDWPAARRAREVEDYRAWVRQTQEFR